MSPVDEQAKAQSLNDRLVSLRTAFHAANGRMQGLPVHNPALSVELRGFRTWGSFAVGILITPWCMNLILLPADNMETEDLAAWKTQRAGQEIDMVLPCGPVRFVVGDDGFGGLYRMCSLFSPMDDFPTLDHAQDVADGVMNSVLVAPAREQVTAEVGERPTAPPEVSRRDLFRGMRGSADADQRG